MSIYCGVEFHARQQTVCYCDTADGQRAQHLGELAREVQPESRGRAGFSFGGARSTWRRSKLRAVPAHDRNRPRARWRARSRRARSEGVTGRAIPATEPDRQRAKTGSNIEA